MAGQNAELFGYSFQENLIAGYRFFLAVFYFVTASTFWDGKPWIRIPTIIVVSVTVIATWILFSFGFSGTFESILSTALMSIVAIYLMKPNVKKYFVRTPVGSQLK